MSKAYTALVRNYFQLPEEERTKFRDLIMQPSGSNAELYGEITDEDIDAMGVDAFMRLEEEENAAQTRRGVEG